MFLDYVSLDAENGLRGARVEVEKLNWETMIVAEERDDGFWTVIVVEIERRGQN